MTTAIIIIVGATIGIIGAIIGMATGTDMSVPSLMYGLGVGLVLAALITYA